MKICSKCNIEKLLDEFYLKKRNKDGHMAHCKICDKKNCKEYRENNRDKEKERHRIYNENNQEKIKENKAKWLSNNKEKKKIIDKTYRENNKEKERERQRKWAKDNPEKVKAKTNRYRKNNLEKVKERNRRSWENFRKNNPKKVSENYNKWVKKRKAIDPVFKLKHNITSVIYQAIKRGGFSKKSKTYQILGCSYEFIMNYIESQWVLPHNLDSTGKIWMNWDNYGKYKKRTLYYGWDIDHIIPLLPSKRSEKELIELCHYKNLQPLCSYTNRYIKKNRLDWIK